MILRRLFLAFGWIVAAQAALMTMPVMAGPSLLIDAASGQVLKADEATRPWHPASTTKMMTVYVALKAVRAGRIGLETAIPVSRLAASQPRVKVYAKPGSSITLDNAIKVMMVKSANDIAYVIAEGVGGNVGTFVQMMNNEARNLGMRTSNFTNPNGWHHPDQYTSARDLGVLAMALMREFPEYSDYWGIGAVQIGRAVLTNTNGLIGRYSGASGFKTGFVCASGFNLVATANRGGRTLIAIVMGALSGSERTVTASQLLDEGFSSWAGGGYSLNSLPGSGYSSPTNICSEVRRRGGGGALADDVDTTGPISAVMTSAWITDNPMNERFVLPQAQSASVGGRNSSGRITLGPRAQFEPIQISYGPTAGTANAPLAANATGAKPATQVARTGSPSAAPIAGGVLAAGTIAADAVALRPATSETDKPVSAAEQRRIALRNGGIPLPSSANAFAPTAPAASNGPLKLQGAAGADASRTVPLRPGAAAGIRAPAKPAMAALTPAQQKASGKTLQGKATPIKPALAKPALAKPALAKASQTKTVNAKPATAKPVIYKPVASKPKPVPANDD
jgi:D-alanyl-D-alanine carboxypeptidase